MHCVRYKRVRSRNGGTVRRCAQYSGRRRSKSTGYRKAKRRASSRRKRHCTRKKTVYSPFLRKRVTRCAKYSGGKRGGTSRRTSYRKGRKPFNKGRKCVAWGEKTDTRTGKSRRYCRSYGGNPAWRRRGKGAGGGGMYPGTVSVSRSVPRGAIVVTQPKKPGFFARLLGAG